MSRGTSHYYVVLMDKPITLKDDAEWRQSLRPTKEKPTAQKAIAMARFEIVKEAVESRKKVGEPAYAYVVEENQYEVDTAIEYSQNHRLSVEASYTTDDVVVEDDTPKFEIEKAGKNKVNVYYDSEFIGVIHKNTAGYGLTASVPDSERTSEWEGVARELARVKGVAVVAAPTTDTKEDAPAKDETESAA